MPDHWSSAYVGLPYKARGRNRDGLDCWGLLRLVYAEQLGVALPSYIGAPDTAERRELDALISGEAASWWQRVADPVPFDAVLFRVGPFAAHVGVVVTPGVMLHITRDDCAKLEAWTAPRWCSRLAGIYRRGVAP